jgi:hypothetical protein
MERIRDQGGKMKVGDLVRYKHNPTLYLVTWINQRFMRVLGGDRAFRYANADWSVVSESG